MDTKREDEYVSVNQRYRKKQKQAYRLYIGQRDREKG